MVVETAAKPPGKAVKPDDSTVVISKMLSWLLRHGIKHKSAPGHLNGPSLHEIVSIELYV